MIPSPVIFQITEEIYIINTKSGLINPKHYFIPYLFVVEPENRYRITIFNLRSHKANFTSKKGRLSRFRACKYKTKIPLSNRTKSFIKSPKTPSKAHHTTTLGSKFHKVISNEFKILIFISYFLWACLQHP